MKAMVFAAGVGSRLKELTRDTPKCLMPIGDSTMLELVIERLKQAGVTAVAINLHHHPQKIIDFVESKGRFGLEVIFSHESTLLDTGGGLKKVRDFFEGEEAFLIHNSDIYSSCDLSALVADHKQRKAIGTLAVMERACARGLYFDRNDVLVGWTQESQGAPEDGRCLAFSGISVASSELFAFMEEKDTFSLIRPYLAAARATQRVWGSVMPAADWIDIGTPDQLLELRMRLNR